MPYIKIWLPLPLNIDVAKIASYFPEFRYREPFTSFSGKACTSEFILNDSNNDREQVLFFDDKTAAGFTSISSQYPPKELAVLFSRLPAELSEPLITALQKTELEIPKISENERQKIMAAQEAQKIREAKLIALRKPLKGAIAVDFKPTQAVTVLQHEFSITNATSEQPILGTFGAGPCIILALYDSAKKTAILAHIDAMTPIASLSGVLQHVSPNAIAHLAGGDASSQSMCIDLIEFLTKNHIHIENADVIQHSFGGTSLAIDARTGKIYSPVEPNQLYTTSDIDLRLQMAGMQFMKTPLKQYHFKPVVNHESVILTKKADHHAAATGIKGLAKLETEFGSFFAKEKRPDSKSSTMSLKSKRLDPTPFVFIDRRPSPAVQPQISIFQKPKKQDLWGETLVNSQLNGYFNK